MRQQSAELWLRTYFAGDHQTWGDNSRTLPIIPDIPLAPRGPDSDSPMIIFGYSLNHMTTQPEFVEFDRIFVQLPTAESSRVGLAVRWVSGTGLTLTGAGSKDYYYRSWGEKRVRSVKGFGQIGGPHYMPSEPVAVPSRIVGRVPGNGVWFVTLPSRDFPAVDRPRPNLTLTPDPIGVGNPTGLEDFFFCPAGSAETKAEHTLADTCVDPDIQRVHRDCRHNLGLLLACHMRWLVWPPLGWEMPFELDQQTAKRYQRYTRNNKMPRENLGDLWERAKAAGQTDTPLQEVFETLIACGVASWARLNLAIDEVHSHVPVDWKAPPEKALLKTAPPEVARESSVKVWSLPRGLRGTRHLRPWSG